MLVAVGAGCVDAQRIGKGGARVLVRIGTRVHVVTGVAVCAGSVLCAVAVKGRREGLCMADPAIERSVGADQFWVVMAWVADRSPCGDRMTRIALERRRQVIPRLARGHLAVVARGAPTRDGGEIMFEARRGPCGRRVARIALGGGHDVVGRLARGRLAVVARGTLARDRGKIMSETRGKPRGDRMA